jgi:hypothetical protein
MNQENEFFDKARKVAQMLDNQSYIYTPSSTDITIRWRKLYNYVPASEQPRYIKKWADFREMMNRTLHDVEVPKPEGVLIWKKQSKSL